jgi:hypothetical protein
MKKRFVFEAGLIAVLFAAGRGMAADEHKKIAQTGFQFMSVVSDARAAALSSAVTSVEMGSSSLFFNPAGMANMSGFVDMSASYNKWIGEIVHQTVSLAIKPAHGNYGVIGVSAQTVNYGEVLGTIVSNRDPNGFMDTEVFKPTAFAVGLGYAKALSDRFSIGGQVKMVRQDFGDMVVPETDSTTTSMRFRLTPLSYDFGTLFKTGLKSLAFGMSVRNFSSEIKYVDEGFQLPLVFAMGVSMDLMDWIPVKGPSQSALLSVDLSHDRSHVEQLRVGIDYQFMKILSLRGGFVTAGDEEKWSFGVGVQKFGLALDYAYTPYGIFNQIQRMSVRFSL